VSSVADRACVTRPQRARSGSLFAFPAASESSGEGKGDRGWGGGRRGGGGMGGREMRRKTDGKERRNGERGGVGKKRT